MPTARTATLARTSKEQYGTVTRDGVLVGSYYCADRARQFDWHIITALGRPLALDGQPVNPVSEGAAVVVLTTILAARNGFEVEQRLRDATHPRGDR